MIYIVKVYDKEDKLIALFDVSSYEEADIRLDEYIEQYKYATVTPARH